MDNASKALVMVGAILIAVMLISLGVFLFTYARDAAEDQTGRMDELTVSAFNQQFNSYLGSSIQGSSAKALVSIAKAAKVQIIGGANNKGVRAGDLDSTKSYVIFEDYGTDGRINKITIQGVNGSES